MNDLISRKALLEALAKYQSGVSELNPAHDYLDDVENIITNTPAIEQGELVAIVDEVAISWDGKHIFNAVGKVNVGDKLYATPPQPQEI